MRKGRIAALVMSFILLVTMAFGSISVLAGAEEASAVTATTEVTEQTESTSADEGVKAQADEASNEEETTVAEETTAEETTAAKEETTTAPETTAAKEETTKAQETTAAKEETTKAQETTAAKEETTKAQETTAAKEETTKAKETTAAKEETTKAEKETTTSAKDKLKGKKVKTQAGTFELTAQVSTANHNFNGETVHVTTGQMITYAGDSGRTVKDTVFNSDKVATGMAYAIVASGSTTLNLDNITFTNNNNGGIARGNAGSTINIKNSTFKQGTSTVNTSGIFGNSNDKSNVTFNFNDGENKLQDFTSANIYGKTNVTGGTLTIENSSIKYDNSAALKVKNGATLVVGAGSTLNVSGLTVEYGGTLKLVGDGKVIGSNPKLSSGATLDLSQSKVYTTQDSLNDSPFDFNSSGVKVKGIEYNVSNVYIYDGEKGTFDDEGNFTETPTPDEPTVNIKNNSVTITVIGGTPQYSDETEILVYAGGTLDVSAMESIGIDNVPADIPGKLILYKDSNLVLNTYEIKEVIANNNESVTMAMDGENVKITKDPNFGAQKVKIVTSMVNVTAKNYTVSDDAPITINNGGKLYFNAVTLDDSHKITINSGGKSYLKGENHFGDTETEVAMTNAGQILVHPDAASSEIKNSNLKMTGAGNITVDNGKTLTIDPTTITPVGNQQIFVESGGTLTMEDTEVDLSQCNVRYIVLRDGATLNLKNCTFKNAPKLGVIRANGNNTINIEECTFENNIANGGAYPQEQGGVLVVEKTSNVTIKGSTFTNNQASKWGGAIWQNGGTLNIEKSTFDGNEAMTANGGAIYFIDGDSLNIGAGNAFKSNTATNGYGGAVYVKNSKITVNAAAFDENTAKKGGAIFIANGGDSKINNGATFNKNTATSDGGAVAVYDDDSKMVGAKSLTIGEATFAENKTTGGYGGAVYAGLIEKVDLNGTTFDKNEALRGGAVCIKDYNLSNVNGASFTNNKAVSEENHSNQAGALYSNFEHYLDGGVLNINGSTFTNNEAGTGEADRIVPYGGAIALDSKITDGVRQTGATVYIGDANGTPTTFTGNKVNGAGEFAGGALCIHDGSKVYMKDAAIYDNYADDAGAGIATCHIGTTQVNVFEGAAIFNNTVGGAESLPEAKGYQDIYEFFRDMDTRGSVLYERMFNGGLHMWKSEYLYDVDEWSGGYGTAVIAQSEPTNTDTSKARVVFKENSANRYPDSAGTCIASGGAISCNGELYIGTQAELKIVKLWDDDQDNKGYRPSAEEFLKNVHLYANGTEVDLSADDIQVDVIEDASDVILDNNIINRNPDTAGSLEVNGKKAWVIVVSNLPLNDAEGNPITYTVDEGNIQHYYTELPGEEDEHLIITNRAHDDFEIKKVDENGKPIAGVTFDVYGKPEVEVTGGETVNISVAKLWEPDENLDNDKIEELDQPINSGATATINLLANGEVVDSFETSAESVYQVKTFKNLPVVDENGNEIKYTVEEVNAPEGYDVYIQGSAAEGFYIVNTQYDYYTIEPAVPIEDVGRIRIVVDGEDTTPKAKIPELYNATVITTGTETEIRVPKKFTLKDVNDLEGEYEFNFTKETPGTNIENTTFDAEVKYTLTYPDLTVETVKTKAEADKKAAEWKKLITGTTDENGILYLRDWAVKGNIKVVEVSQPDAYIATETATETNLSVGSVEITNDIRRTSIEVTKDWKDNDNQDGVRPEKITVNVFGDGVMVNSAELNADNNWYYQFENLPAYKTEKGKAVEIKYTVEEEAVAGYTTVVTGNQNKGFTVTNTHKTEVVEVEVNKIWDDNNDEFGKRPATVEVVLLADKQQVGSVKLDAAGSWSYKFTDLPKYKNGREIDYTIEEKVESPLYNPSVKKAVKGNVITYDITNTYEAGTRDITLIKQWDDEDNKRKVRPNEITVTLYGYYFDDNDEDITVVEEEVKVKPDASGDWKVTFNDLPATVDGNEVEYELEEDTVYWYAPTPDINWNGNRVYMKNTYDENNGPPDETTTPERTQPETKDKNTTTTKSNRTTTSSSNKKSPKTGDATSTAIWFILLGAAAATAGVVVYRRRRNDA